MSRKNYPIFIQKEHIDTIKRISAQYKARYDAGWVGSNPNFAFLICIGAGPWKVQRREQVQRTAITWFLKSNLEDLVYTDLQEAQQLYPLQWQNNHLCSLIKALRRETVVFHCLCAQWKKQKEDWREIAKKLFNMCGVSDQGTKVLWLFIRDLLQLPAFPVDRWVRRNLEKHDLPSNAWYMTEACLQAGVNPNKLNRALFEGINPKF